MTSVISLQFPVLAIIIEKCLHIISISVWMPPRGGNITCMECDQTNFTEMMPRDGNVTCMEYCEQTNVTCLNKYLTFGTSRGNQAATKIAITQRFSLNRTTRMDEIASTINPFTTHSTTMTPSFRDITPSRTPSRTDVDNLAETLAMATSSIKSRVCANTSSYSQVNQSILLQISSNRMLQNIEQAVSLTIS